MRVLVLLSLVLSLSACAPRVDESEWPKPLECVDVAARGEGEQWITKTWWKAFSDAQLDALIDQALSCNPGLAVAEARVREACAAAGIAGSARFPDIEASINHDVTKYSSDSLLRNHTSVRPVVQSTNLNLKLRYTFDFWGQNRKRFESALGSARAREAEAEAARLTIATAVAESYFRLWGAEVVRGILTASLERYDEWLALMRLNIDAGLMDEIAYEGALQRYYTFERELSGAAQECSALRHALGALLAQPGNLFDQLTFELQARHVKVPLPKSLPVDLIARRPDLKAKLHEVKSALLEVDVAKADFYPNIDLAGFFGVQAISIGQIFRERSMTGGGMPALHLPILTGGRLRSNYTRRIANYEALVHSYNEKVIESAQQVADCACDLHFVCEKLMLQKKERVSSMRCLELTALRMQSGLDPYTQLLEKTIEDYQQLAAVVELEKFRSVALVKLMEALGGGYGS